MKALLEELLIVFILCAVSLGVPLALSMVWYNYSCKTQAGVMGKPATWGPVQGCMIQVKGEWVPIERYRVVD